jgi:hypothetical protein
MKDYLNQVLKEVASFKKPVQSCIQRRYLIV